MTLSSGLNTEYATSMREAQGKGGKYWTSSGKSVDIYNDHMVTMNERFNDKIDVNIALGEVFHVLIVVLTILRPK